MQPTQPERAFDIRYVTDVNGIPEFVQIPFVQWKFIREKLLHEEDYAPTEERPEVIDREGILVVKAEPLDDLARFVRDERERRISDFFRRNMG